jgi:hypothetical protein
MNFEKFYGDPPKNKTRPAKMHVGQIVERRTNAQARYYLHRLMREAMKYGMEFSTALEGDVYAIRRDK